MPPKPRICLRASVVAGMVREARIVDGLELGVTAQRFGDASRVRLVLAHPYRQRLGAAQREPGIPRVPGTPPVAFCAKRSDSKSVASSTTTAPPITSECPPRYLVVECTTTCAPSAIGFCRNGVAKVLSTTSQAPRRRAISAHAAMSIRRSIGFVGLSIQTMRVAGSRACSIASGRVASTYVKRTPKLGRIFEKSRCEPP